MAHIDSAVLDAVQRLCRRFQLLTGRTNIWLAFQFTNLSIVVYFVWAMVYFWNTDRATRFGLVLFCSLLLYVLTQTIFRERVQTYESSAYQRVAKGLANPRRVRDALLRIPFLTLSIALLYPAIAAYREFRIRMAPLTYCLIVLTTIVLYLLACDPLPPCTGRLKAWMVQFQLRPRAEDAT